MPKPIIITSLGFKKRGQVKGLRDLCKYLQYRDGPVRREAFLGGEHRYLDGLSDYIAPQHRDRKWVDRGMGETYKQIASRAFDWQGRRTLARTWVISPDPELMKHVPEEWRFDVVRNVTERMVERWYSDNGWGQAEYSYVIHDKRRAADGEQMVHAHLITPGTIPIDAAEDRGRGSFRRGGAGADRRHRRGGRGHRRWGRREPGPGRRQRAVRHGQPVLQRRVGQLHPARRQCAQGSGAGLLRGRTVQPHAGPAGWAVPG